MSSRDAILKTIRTNQPPEVALPTWQFDAFDNCTERFQQSLETIGATVSFVGDHTAIKAYYESQMANGLLVLSFIESISPVAPASLTYNELEKVDQLFIKGTIAVAENGAIWISEKAMGHRAAPFLCQHLVIVVNESDLVANMHEAYQRIDTTAEGFGAFIAGPSKTADIEQSLVIGAHGPISLQVFIIANTIS